MTNLPAIDQIDRAIQMVVAERHVPRATYRLQFSQSFTFRDAEALVPYLHRLGITDLYASPLQKATPGSTHGYDICDPTQLNPELGTREDFDRLTATLAAHDMYLLLDIVPNHMGIHASCNRWWYDVLENGPASAYAAYFDIDWSPVKPEVANKVLLPVLEDQYGNVLDSGKLTVVYLNGGFELAYGEFRWPIAPGTYADLLEPCLDPIVEHLGALHDDVIELQSIVTAIRHLPARDVDNELARQERHREKEVIKRRLAALVDRNEMLRGVVDRVLTDFNGLPGDQSSFNRLDALLREQAYRLAYWRVAGEEINYRRFFDVNSMAAINNELPEVFEVTHGLILELLASGQVSGLRVDHPDGLWNPRGYFQMLQAAYLSRRVCAMLDVTSNADRAAVDQRVASWLEAHAGTAEGRPLYVIAEKILSESEPLPVDWAVSGTTGYDFMNQVNGLFVDRRYEAAFDSLYTNFIGRSIDFGELEYQSKRMIMSESLAGEINTLAHRLERLTESNRHYRDFTLNSLRLVIREVVACLGIYRTYVTGPDAVSMRDQLFVEAAIQAARRRNPRIAATLFVFVRDCLLMRNYYEFTEPQRSQLLDWVMRFQQVTGPVMAKSVEDTAFYIYNRLPSLNEVGGQPGTFGIGLDEFHQQNRQRHETWPHAMTSTSTHDTKRSEDVRARLNVLSELPDDWTEAITHWHDLNSGLITAHPDGPAPDPNDEYLLYYALVGTLTATDLTNDEARARYVTRIQDYMAKATREAKLRTSWTHGDAQYDEATSRFIGNVLNPAISAPFLESLTGFVERIAFYGRINSLSQTVLKLMSPGVPDAYRGTEGWDFSLVDPDNRRPVDYQRVVSLLDRLNASDIGQRSELIASLVESNLEADLAKLFVTHTALTLRSRCAAFFERARYVPLAATGKRADHVCAFAWQSGEERIIVVVPRLVVGLTGGAPVMPLGHTVWGDTTLRLPHAARGSTLTDAFTGVNVPIKADGEPPPVAIGTVFDRFPVAVLINTSDLGAQS